MSTHSIDDAQKPTDDDLQTTNNTDVENTNDEKIICSGEIVVTIEESLKENLKRDINDRDFMVYGYHAQNQALPTTWVYFQQGNLRCYYPTVVCSLCTL